MALFLTSVCMKDVLKSSIKSFQVLKSGEARVAFLVAVEALVKADPSFMKDRVNMILFWSVS